MEEKKEEIQEESQTEALLEPTPYKRKADKETDDTATASEDTATENAATPEERPVNAEEKVFKKRYDDLKRHYDSTVNKHKDEKSQLKRQLEEKTESFKLPKTKEEIEDWRKKYPDVYDVISTIAHTKADEKAKQVQTKMKDLEVAQANVAKDKAEVELSKLHPDFKDIRADEKFHEWVAGQDSTIQGWLYDNSTNATLASRAIDLYKMDAGLTKKVKVDKKEASKSVTSTSKQDIEAGEMSLGDIARKKRTIQSNYQRAKDTKEGEILAAEDDLATAEHKYGTDVGDILSDSSSQVQTLLDAIQSVPVAHQGMGAHLTSRTDQPGGGAWAGSGSVPAHGRVEGGGGHGAPAGGWFGETSSALPGYSSAISDVDAATAFADYISNLTNPAALAGNVGYPEGYEPGGEG